MESFVYLLAHTVDYIYEYVRQRNKSNNMYYLFRGFRLKLSWKIILLFVKEKPF